MKTLKQAYKDYFMIGAAVSAHWLNEAEPTILEHFNCVTAENEMKYNSIHPHDYPRPDFWRMKPGEKPEPPVITNRERFVHPSLETDFSGGDAIYNFALENGLAVRGHNLAWHASYPWGIFEQLTPEEIRTNLDEHFSLVAEHYPKCFCWDVVNEAMDDKHGLYLRETVYKQKLGDDYLYEIYTLARKYFPEAQLVCNDYNEANPHKRDNILRLVSGLKERGLVDVIGCQCHINAMMTEEKFDEYRRALEMYAETGLRIHITEMDVNCINWEKPGEMIKPTEETVHKGAEVYGKMFALFREYRDVIDCVTLWGVSDMHSWLNFFKNGKRYPNYPLLFDDKYNCKEALQRVVDF